MGLPKPYYDDGRVVIYHGDCRTLLAAGIPRTHSVVTDPPYGDTQLPWDTIASGWLAWLEKWTEGKPTSLWMFTSLRHLLHVAPELHGWSLAEEIVWEKHNGTNLRRDRFRRVHELAVRFYRGEWEVLARQAPRQWQARSRVVRKQSRPSQWLGATGPTTFVQEAGETKLMRSVIYARSEHRRGWHPTQKPLAVTRALVESSTSAGECVLDPFSGAGTTLVAAASCGRRAIGIEIEERYCEIAARRCAQEVLL